MLVILHSCTLQRLMDTVQIGFISEFHGAGGRDSSVGIATRYGLGSPGIVFRVGAIFSAPVQTGPGAHPASYKTGTEHLSWG
jgi:hypothetical protein